MVLKWRRPPEHPEETSGYYTEAPSVCQTGCDDRDETTTEIQLQRPKRADARRNYDKLVAAARAVFAEDGTSAPLEDVAERAGVGIGTLYRHFPTRQALLEAVYVDEVEAMARAAEELAELAPWDALAEWLHRYVGFAATKRALTEALLEVAPDSDVLGACRTAIVAAGTALLERAQRRASSGRTRTSSTSSGWSARSRSSEGRSGAEGAAAPARTRRAALPAGRLAPRPAALGKNGSVGREERR